MGRAVARRPPSHPVGGRGAGTDEVPAFAPRRSSRNCLNRSELHWPRARSRYAATSRDSGGGPEAVDGAAGADGGWGFAPPRGRRPGPRPLGRGRFAPPQGELQLLADLSELGLVGGAQALELGGQLLVPPGQRLGPTRVLRGLLACLAELLDQPVPLVHEPMLRRPPLLLQAVAFRPQLIPIRGEGVGSPSGLLLLGPGRFVIGVEPREPLVQPVHLGPTLGLGPLPPPLELLDLPPRDLELRIPGLDLPAEAPDLGIPLLGRTLPLLPDARDQLLGRLEIPAQGLDPSQELLDLAAVPVGLASPLVGHPRQLALELLLAPEGPLPLLAGPLALLEEPPDLIPTLRLLPRQLVGPVGGLPLQLVDALQGQLVLPTPEVVLPAEALEFLQVGRVRRERIGRPTRLGPERVDLLQGLAMVATTPLELVQELLGSLREGPPVPLEVPLVGGEPLALASRRLLRRSGGAPARPATSRARRGGGTPGRAALPPTGSARRRAGGPAPRPRPGARRWPRPGGGGTPRSRRGAAPPARRASRPPGPHARAEALQLLGTASGRALGLGAEGLELGS